MTRKNIRSNYALTFQYQKENSKMIAADAYR